MGLLILLAMIGIPLIEIAVFIEVGGEIGLFNTVAIVVLTAMAGTALLRHQGLVTLFRVRESLERGEFPIAAVFDGMCLLVAGALLLTPGFVTDGVGLLLFVPAVRTLLRGWLGRHLVATGRVRTWHEGPAGPRGGPTVIEGECREIDEEEAPDDGNGRHGRR